MKKFLVLIILILSLNNVLADCSSSGIYFYPSNKEISLNPMFVIEGYYNSQKTIEALNTRTIYLISEKGERIQLILERINIGQMYLTQAIFKPIKELSTNTKYYLQYSNQTELESSQLETWDPVKKKKERVYWITNETKISNLLNSELTIEYKNTDIAYFGCGPAAYALFSIKKNTTDDIWFSTEVMEIATGEKSIYLLKADNTTLSVGHGMCSGAFTFKKKGKYKVRFTPMNIDGKSLKTTNWITFESPFSNN